MTSEKLNKTHYKFLNVNLRVLFVFCFMLYGLAIFQDYLFSRFKSTGFYWSDTMLYNTYWLLFIPFFQLARYLYSKFEVKTPLNKVLYAIISGLVFSGLHILCFTSVFILGSHMIYPIPHRFLTILKNAISNQSHITLILYISLPYILEYLNKKQQLKKAVPKPHQITVKNGTKRLKVETSTILYIQTNRPYTTVVTEGQKLLHDESLKTWENQLDSEIFIRVHRSAMINKNHVVEITSRKNGDYDGVMTNGAMIRFSRHYRQNWKSLLLH